MDGELIMVYPKKKKKEKKKKSPSSTSRLEVTSQGARAMCATWNSGLEVLASTNATWAIRTSLAASFECNGGQSFFLLSKSVSCVKTRVMSGEDEIAQDEGRVGKGQQSDEGTAGSERAWEVHIAAHARYW